MQRCFLGKCTALKTCAKVCLPLTKFGLKTATCSLDAREPWQDLRRNDSHITCQLLCSSQSSSIVVPSILPSCDIELAPSKITTSIILVSSLTYRSSGAISSCWKSSGKASSHKRSSEIDTGAHLYANLPSLLFPEYRRESLCTLWIRAISIRLKRFACWFCRSLPLQPIIGLEQIGRSVSHILRPGAYSGNEWQLQSCDAHADCS